MTRLGIVLTALIALAALTPGGAAARHLTGGNNCNYVDSEPNVAVPPGFVYAGSGNGGTTDDNMLVFVGACADNQPLPIGGTAECAVGEDADTDELLDAVPTVGTDAYCVVDGDNDNPSPFDGYVGVSSYEDTANESARNVDGDCTGNGGTNGGSCIGLSQGVSINQPPITFGVAPFGCQTDDLDPDDTLICADPNHDGDEIEVGHPTPICGSTSGNQWESSSRDGCSVP